MQYYEHYNVHTHAVSALRAVADKELLGVFSHLLFQSGTTDWHASHTNKPFENAETVP